MYQQLPALISLMGFQFHYTAYFPPTLFIQHFMLRKIIPISLTPEDRHVEASSGRAVSLVKFEGSSKQLIGAICHRFGSQKLQAEVFHVRALHGDRP